MTSRSDISSLIARVRSGDQEAVAELVRDYEPYVRRAIRIQLRDPRLRSTLDTADICQSVLASFFARLALGQYDLDQPGHLAALLARMARTKVATRARRAEITRRDRQGQAAHTRALIAVPASGPDPSQIAAGRDLLEQFQLRLKADELALSDRRAEGQSWAEIASELGSTPEALRKKLGRALDRVASELGLDDSADF
jgi:RNA polymerase sigma-70 factor (ECF subfamily)